MPGADVWAIDGTVSKNFIAVLLTGFLSFKHLNLPQNFAYSKAAPIWKRSTLLHLVRMAHSRRWIPTKPLHCAYVGSRNYLWTSCSDR
jgi:hypothetical protein